MDKTDSSEPRFAQAVRRVQDGDAERFSELVNAFQDMAVGYAYSVLGDRQLAEDAAQEAFLDAYRHIGALREPLAFPGWLRRIVFKHCDRWTRRKAPAALPLELAGEEPSPGPTPAEIVEENEMRDRLMAALELLPEKQRSVLVLHHMTGHSLAEISTFLDLPLTTVKKRLHDARAHLREVVLDGLTESLRAQRPSQDAAFAQGVVEMLHAARRGDSARVKDLLKANPRLRDGRDFMGNTALIMAVASGHQEVASLLIEAGAPVDIHEAAAVDDTTRVAAWLDEQPGLVDALSSHGFTALALAAHFGCVATLRLLLKRGADPNIVMTHPIGTTALIGALFGRQAEAAAILIEYGASVRARRGGPGWPRAGWTPLHYAAANGFVEIMIRLLERGADPEARDDKGATPLDAAREEEQLEAVRLLHKEEAC